MSFVQRDYPPDVPFNKPNAFSWSLSFPDTSRDVDLLRLTSTVSIEFPFISVKIPPASFTSSQPPAKSKLLDGEGFAKILIAPQER